MNAQTVLDFWWQELTPQQWFARDAAVDQQIAERFTDLHRRAAQGELADWRVDMPGRLAEIIVLDQFSRNLFRDDARAFACDGMAVVLTQTALQHGDISLLNPQQASFLLMPLMHSESAQIHAYAAPLFARWATDLSHEFAIKHRVIIERFGRYPHRNAVLGRPSTAEENAFLQQPGSSF